jgi:transcription-repair coupling factor (superfamily II helicase)
VPLDLTDVLDEFIDRFGIPPKEVRRLIKISLIRALATKCDIKKVEYRDGTLTFVSENPSLAEWSLVTSEFTMLRVRASAVPSIQARVKCEDEAIDLASGVLQKYYDIITPKEGEDDAKK